MEIIKNYKLIILLLLPFFLGWLINNSNFFLSIYINIFWIINIGFVVYWFWVGKQFGQLRVNKLLLFLLGNMVWAILFGLFIWQFEFVDDLKRNMFIAGISQYYGLFTVVLSTRIVMLFKDFIDGTEVMIISYILMLVIFLIGFVCGAIRLSGTKQNNISNEYSDTVTK